MKASKCCPSSSEVAKVRCAIEAIITLDERGQILLPKELREKAKIKAGDKLVAIACGREDICCIVLMPAEKLSEQVRQFLGPFLRELIRS